MQKSLAAKGALLAAALIWGSSFVVMKNSVDAFPMFTLLAIRFLSAALLLAAIFRKKLRQMTRGTCLGGGLIGIALFVAYTVQTMGLMQTTPGKNAFLTAVYCVLVPFLHWMVYRKKPRVSHFAAAALCIAGIGIVSLDGEMSMNQGDLLTLIGGVCFAVHIILLNHFSKKQDIFLLTMVQFFVAGVCALGFALSSETFPSNLTAGNWAGLAYLAIFATTLALLFQSVGQKYTSPQSASILLSLESVFGVAFSVLFYHEEITIKLVGGFLIIFVAILVSEYRPKQGGKGYDFRR